MEPNLTYSIVLNPSINATLNPAPSTLIKDYLPSMMAIVVVMLGSFITYLSALRLKRIEHQFEDRKEIYIHALSLIVEIEQIFDDIEASNQHTFKDIIREKEDLQQRYENTIKQVYTINAELSIFASLLVSVAFNSVMLEVNKTIADWSDHETNKKNLALFQKSKTSLIEKMRTELNVAEGKSINSYILLREEEEEIKKKGWWPFWK